MYVLGQPSWGPFVSSRTRGSIDRPVRPIAALNELSFPPRGVPSYASPSDRAPIFLKISLNWARVEFLQNFFPIISDHLERALREREPRYWWLLRGVLFTNFSNWAEFLYKMLRVTIYNDLAADGKLLNGIKNYSSMR